MSEMNSKQAKTEETCVSVMDDVIKDLEFKIMSGEYAAGDKLPTIRELTKLYGIGLHSAQGVVNSLYADGIIVKRPNVGFFVKPYVAGSIKEKHEANCKGQLRRLIEYAKRFDIDPAKLISEVLKEYE